jgi:hypothetical protein
MFGSDLLLVSLCCRLKGTKPNEFVSPCQDCHVMLTGAVLRHHTSQKYKKEIQTPAGRKIISKIGSDLVAPSSPAVTLVTAQIELVYYTPQSRNDLCFMGQRDLTLAPSESALTNSLIDRPCVLLTVTTEPKQ